MVKRIDETNVMKSQYYIETINWCSLDHFLYFCVSEILHNKNIYCAEVKKIFIMMV